MKLKTRMVVAIGSVLMIVLATAFAFMYSAQKSQSDALYYSQAKSINDSLKLVRKVISGHGGVFAKQKDGFSVNEYLAEIPGIPSEMKNAKGDKFALMNGFSFLQEMSAISQQDAKAAFSYRSPRENPFNPVNKPTNGELAVLKDMKAGAVTEHHEKVTDESGKKTYRFSSAMPTDESCMKCHPNFTPGGVDSMMVVSLPIDEAEARNAASMMNIIYVFAAAVILVLGLTYWLAGRITAPIKHLAEVADRVSKGDLDVNIDVTRGDEIGELAEAFNRLIASVKILSMSGDQ